MYHLRLVSILLFTATGCAVSNSLESPDAYLIVDGKKHQMIPGSSCWIDICDDRFFSETLKHPVVIASESKLSLKLQSSSEIDSVVIENIATKHLETFIYEYDFDEMEPKERRWFEQNSKNHITWRARSGEEEYIQHLRVSSQVDLAPKKIQRLDLDLEPGRYILSVLSWWSDGDASFEILIELEP